MVTNSQTSSGVSFVIPVYNKANHLPGVLRQIKNQRGNFSKQYVFLDDGSTDDSLNIIRAETANWNNTVIKTQSNKGSAAATNAAIKLATQRYIKFVDADDLLTENATKVLLNNLKKSDACLIFGEQQSFFSASELELCGPSEHTTVEVINQPLRLALRNSLFNPSQCLVRTDAIRKVGGCDEAVIHSQEYGLTLRLAKRWQFLRLNDTVVYLPEKSYGRLSTNEGRQLQRVTLSVAHFLNENPDVSSSIKRYACRRVAGRALKYVKRRGEKVDISRWYFRYLAAKLNLIKDHALFAAECVSAFKVAEKTSVEKQAPNY